MKELWLTRHAKSSWKDLNITDFNRTLNDRGNHDAPMMGEIIKEIGIQLDLMISSPALRAISTATIIAEKIDYPVDQIFKERKIYEASFQDLLSLIYRLENDKNTVMIVGHNPGLTVLSNYQTDYYIDNLPTCGMVKIQFEIESWEEIIKGIGSIESFEYPKKYKKV